MLRIEYVTKLKLKITSTNNSELDELKRLFTTKEKVRTYDYKRKRTQWITQDVEQFQVENNGILVGHGYLPVIEELLIENDCEYEIIGAVKKDPIKILDKYWEMFNSHPKGEHYIQVQRSFGHAVEKSTFGTISQFTGAGKSSMLFALADSFLQDETKSGNVVIISYSSKVCDELKDRAKSFNIQSERLKILQPTGYCRRKSYHEDLSLYEWDSSVSLFIADECHHFTANSWKDYIERCNPDYIFGFSGSADKDGGWEISLDSIKEKRLESSAFDVMYYCGPAITHEELPTPIRLFRTVRYIADIKEYTSFINNDKNPKQLAPKFTLMNKEFPVIVKEMIEKCIPEDSICYIPELVSIESGVFLCKSLNELGIPTLFLSGQTIESPIGEVSMTLNDIKDMARDKHIKVLISNGVGVEGIDIPGLSSIISLTGRSYKNVVQAIGRSARANVVDCIFIFDKNNGVYNSQAYSRYRTVKNRLNVVSNIEIR